MPADAFGVVYAGLVAAGGLVGFIKAGWPYLESKACSMPHKSIAALKAWLLKEWATIPQEMFQKGSIPSLIAGLVAGTIAGFAALTSNFYILIGVGLILGGVMSVRFSKSGKFVPAGIIALLSILIVIRCIVYFAVKK